MPDQADELRKLVADTPIGPADIATTVLFEGAPVTLFDLSESGAIISSHAGCILVHPGRLSRVKPTPDKAKLWDELKDWALAEALRPSVSSIQTGTVNYKRMERDSDQAHRLYDRMLQAETLATYVKPATPETFARVAEDLKTGGSE